MARLLPEDSIQDELDLTIELVHPLMAEVYYTPPKDELDFFIGSDSDRTTEVSAPRVHILTFDANHSCISVFPVVTSIGHKQYLECKYKKISEITIPVEQVCIPENEQDVIDGLELLPSGFVKDIRYGLGLKKELRFIIDAVEEFTDNSILVICTEEDTGDQDDCFFLNWYDYDEMRKVCNRLTNRARKAAKLTKTASMYNHLAFRLGREQKLLPTSHDAISKMLRIKISDHDKQAALDLVTQDKAVFSNSKPETLGKLKNDIELVTLERLIEQFEQLLDRKSTEDMWQKLFNDNPFILSLTFGYPAIKVRDQASIGGKRLSGEGEKIADYLVKNGLTNNLAIVEIKKPSTQLLNKTAYRGAVYSASKDLAGSVCQVLDQRYHLQQNIANIKVNSRMYDIESYAISCVLIIGTLPEDEDMKKSFEIYRRNSKDVQIVTFDELLLKLNQLRDFLSTCEA
ncbi:Shedu immune nuclease family protein [Vibrio alginolyticus]